MRVHKLYHCNYSLSYHFVFVTKYRRKCFNGAMLDRLKEVVAGLCDDWEAELNEMNGEEDHVHILLGLNPKCAPRGPFDFSARSDGSRPPAERALARGSLCALTQVLVRQ